MVSQWQLINKNYKNMDGYKRVAWPPVSEERVVREFTPQPTSAHYPVSGSLQQEPAQQQQPQHLQQQQPLQQQQQHNAAPANQGIIYNNVTRAVRDNSSHSYQQPQEHQPSDQQQLQQPIQYTQAQFNRQPSREPAGPPFGQHLNDQYGQLTQAPHHQMHNYPVQPQQHEQQYVPNSSSGWRPIRPPMPKDQSEFVTNPVGGAPFYPIHGQQEQSPPQYRATSYDQYQAQPQAQSYQPHQGSQPPYTQQTHYQPMQQQQPSWAHNQPIQQYQPAQAPYQQGPPQSQQQQQYQAAPPSNYQSQAYHQAPPQQQQQSYSTVPHSNQYNSYSQPQDVGLDQPDHRAPAPSLPQEYRGGSPGIITLRKEAPVTQQPAPVYNAQPAAVSFQGGSNMRGDLKWPPPEYKEAAVRENEERRKLAQGPVCRPRKVNRDYTTFFAKNALNSYYPSYKVPPGTQHMLS